MRNLLSAFVITLMTLRCAAVSAQVQESDVLMVQQTAVRALVANFRLQSGWGEPKHYCVAVGPFGKSMNLAFSEALRDINASFLWGSSCEPSCKVPEWYTEPQFECVFIKVGDVQFDGGEKASITGSYLAGPLFGRGGVYRMRKEGASWKLEEFELGWVS